MAFNIDDYAGAGTDTLASSQSMPLINIIQSGSPQFKKSHPAYEDKKIEGCEEGDLVYALDNTLLEKPLKVIPCKCEQTYTEWTDDNKLVAVHDLSIVTHDDYRVGPDPKNSKKQLHKLGNNTLTRTDYYFVKFLQEDIWKDGILALKSTQLAISQRISNIIKSVSKDEQYTSRGIKAPIFGVQLSLSTISDSNDAGSWFSWDITDNYVLNLETDEALLEMGSEAYDSTKLLAAPKEQAAIAVDAPSASEDPY